MKLRKLLVLVLALVMAASILAACGAAKTPETETTTEYDPYALDNIESLESSPIEGKTIIFLGSSVTYGFATHGVSFVDYIAKRNNCTCVKEAKSGTTLIDNGEDSYVERMLNNIDPTIQADLFVCQLSTNDATQEAPLGTISDSTDINSFDTSTVAGAIEYIIAYAEQTWNCPVMFYNNTKYDSEGYQAMVDLLAQIAAKWDITVIDLWNNEELNAEQQANFSEYMWDEIHPYGVCYYELWTPIFEEAIYAKIGQQ